MAYPLSPNINSINPSYNSSGRVSPSNNSGNSNHLNRVLERLSNMTISKEELQKCYDELNQLANDSWSKAQKQVINDFLLMYEPTYQEKIKTLNNDDLKNNIDYKLVGLSISSVSSGECRQHLNTEISNISEDSCKSRIIAQVKNFVDVSSGQSAESSTVSQQDVSSVDVSVKPYSNTSSTQFLPPPPPPPPTSLSQEVLSPSLPLDSDSAFSDVDSVNTYRTANSHKSLSSSLSSVHSPNSEDGLTTRETSPSLPLTVDDITSTTGSDTEKLKRKHEMLDHFLTLIGADREQLMDLFKRRFEIYEPLIHLIIEPNQDAEYDASDPNLNDYIKYAFDKSFKVNEGDFTYWTMNSGNYDFINFIQPSDDKDYSAEAKTELHSILQDVDFDIYGEFLEPIGFVSPDLDVIGPGLDRADNEKLCDLEKFIKDQLHTECPNFSAYRKQNLIATTLSFVEPGASDGDKNKALASTIISDFSGKLLELAKSSMTRGNWEVVKQDRANHFVVKNNLTGEIQDIPDDGSCLFRACLVAHVLNMDL